MFFFQLARCCRLLRLYSSTMLLYLLLARHCAALSLTGLGNGFSNQTTQRFRLADLLALQRILCAMGVSLLIALSHCLLYAAPSNLKMSRVQPRLMLLAIYYICPSDMLFSFSFSFLFLFSLCSCSFFLYGFKTWERGICSLPIHRQSPHHT